MPDLHFLLCLWILHKFILSFPIFCDFCYREEVETPKVWARICIQRMVDLAKETTTMRRVLDPMFTYFDSRQQWIPRQGLAMIVLSDMAYLMENSGTTAFF